VQSRATSGGHEARPRGLREGIRKTMIWPSLARDLGYLAARRPGELEEQATEIKRMLTAGGSSPGAPANRWRSRPDGGLFWPGVPAAGIIPARA